jgi:TolA-binding protein
MTARHSLLAVSLLLALRAPAAIAQVDSREGISLQNQIAELRQELAMMQQAQQGAGPGPQGYAPPQPYPPSYAPPGAGGGGGDTAAELVVRVSALEEQNRALQGRVDDLTNQLQHQHDDFAKQIGDIAFKLGQGGATPPPMMGAEPGFGQPPPQMSPQATPGMAPPMTAPPAAQARRTPELALREGNAALARRDYPAAASAAREALAAGHGATVASAQFLLARAEGGQHQYKEAAADFYQAYNHAPKAPGAPVALLGVANALIAMNDPHDACQALAKLQAEFPGAASVKAGAASARKRAACGR